jgi:superfamily II DNA or RNA helicase
MGTRRPYQDRIITKTLGHFYDDQLNSIMIESPTGSGKTFMGLEVAQEMNNDDPDLTIAWVAMRRFLLGQVTDEMVKHDIKANVVPMSMFDLDGAKQLRAKLGEKPLLIILDEAHHDAAGSMTDLYQALEPDYILGLSATPYRADKAKLCFEKQIRDAGIHRLIQEGWLTKFNMHMIEDWKIPTVLKHYFADPDKWGQSVFYFLTTKEAEECYRGLVAGGVPCHWVQGSDNEATRQEQLADFKSGRVRCLVNCMVLTEGFDCPELETAWVRPSSRGPTMQMAGRVYRLCPGKIKRVVQSQDTRWPISRTANPERQLVWKDNRWLDAKPNTRLAEIAIASMKSCIDNYQPLPEFLTKQAKKEKAPRQFGNPGIV